MVMAASGYWADLNSELVVSIATANDNGMSLRDYMCLRGICTAWRSALALAYPCLLSLIDDRVSVFSLPMRRSFNLWTLAYSNSTLCDRKMGVWSHARLVGSSNGRFAITLGRWIGVTYWTEKIFIVCPRTGEEVEIVSPGMYQYAVVHKIVFAPSPDDGMIVAMYNQKEVSYIDTTSGRDDMKWTAVDFQHARTEHLVDLVFDDAGDGKVYCLDSRGGMRVLHIPSCVRNEQVEPVVVAVEPSQTILRFPGAAVLALPYNIASARNLFFYQDSLYQVWQNIGVTVRPRNGSTMSADEIFVLRYNPERWSHNWDAVKDLGGCSVFVGKNNSPVVARAGAIPGVQADCVYWIDWRGVPMVCDVATGTSKRCVLPYGAGTDNCWYIKVDDMTSIDTH